MKKAARPPRVSVFEGLLQVVRARHPNYAPQWVRSRELFGEAWERELSIDAAAAFGRRKSARWEEAVDGYAEFCTDALRGQVFFERTGRYEAASYSSVIDACYRSEEFMTMRYLPGQYLSHFIWPHHQRMLRHFRGDVIPRLGGVRTFAEVGVGCGLYSQKTLQSLPACTGAGYDISGFSLEFTRRTLSSHGLADRYVLKNHEILSGPPEPPVDFIISQEVLEHLEAPEAFAHRLLEMTRPGGWGYISAAVNAAHTDHIYLYRSPEEVLNQVRAAGWTVVGVHAESAHPEKPAGLRPTVCGLLVRKG